MFGGPQQPAFINAMVNLGVAKGDDLSSGAPNVASLTPYVCH